MPIFNSVYKSFSEWKPGPNTLAYWKLNGTLTDEMGNYNLTNSGTSFYNDTSIGRQVLYCDGNSHYVYTTALPSSDIIQATIKVWCKGIDLFHANRNPFDTSQVGRNNGIRVDSDNSSIIVVFGTPPGEAATVAMPSVTATELNNWHLWTITFNRSDKSYVVYINGVQKNDGTATYSPDGTWFNRLTLGTGFDASAGRSFYGYIGETVLENKIETIDDITLFYNTTKGNYGL